MWGTPFYLGGKMKDCQKYTLRIANNLQKKIKHMAEYNSRSRNKEIETAVKRYIMEFERIHGPIEIDNIEL